jgi:PAS domain S-box-containing protein
VQSPPMSIDVLHEALRQAPGMIVVTDEEQTIIYCNRVENGFKLEDVIGRKHGHALSPEQRSKIEAVMEQARATAQPQQFQAFLDPPSGERRWYSNQISSYTTSDGRSTGMISILTDVTRQRVTQMRLEALRRELMEASHRAGMAEIATGVLDNVGNVLNSINVSVEGLVKELESSRLHLLGRTVAMLEDNEGRLVELLAKDPKGRKLPALLDKLARELDRERQRLHAETSRLRKHIERVRSIVAAQQSLAKLGDMTEPTRPAELIHQTLSMFQVEIDHRDIHLGLELSDIGSVVLDKQATLQVLANLIRNAIEALEAVDRRRELVIRMHADDQKVRFDVEDNGCGIDPGNRDDLFQHGFSTKPNGHGFGLHTAAIAARTMNGTLEAHSEGPGKGARFRLTLPRILP